MDLREASEKTRIGVPQEDEGGSPCCRVMDVQLLSVSERVDRVNGRGAYEICI